jgi:hypothetical protein
MASFDGVTIESHPLLVTALSAAVPLHALEMNRIPYDVLLQEAPKLGDVIAEKGDIIQFKSKKKGETASAFNALAKALALLSFSPGGVRFAGMHFENVHPDNAPKAG